MNHRILLTGIFIVSFLIPVRPCSSKTLVFRNEALSFSFDSDRGFPVTEISHHRTRIVGNDAPQPLWKILWSDERGIHSLLSSDSPGELDSRIENRGEARRLTLEWRNLRVGGGTASVTVTVGMKPDSRLTEWNLAVDWDDTTICPMRIDFPSLSGISSSGKPDYLALPYYLGRKVNDPVDRLPYLQLMYPGPASMQFISYFSGSTGLYLAAYDPELRMKAWVWKGKEANGTGSLRIENYPPYGTRRHFEIPYPVVIGLVEGDWYDAARIYRDWATSRKWCAKGKVAIREDIPAWFRDTALWLKYYGEPGKVLAELFDHLSTLKVPVSLLYYRYPENRFDDNYPEYLPARKGFIECIESIHRLGSHVIPYTNGSIWDTDTRSWRIEKGIRGALKTPSNDIYRWDIHSNVFAYMCPYSEVWQNQVADFAWKLILDYDTDGIYLDVLAAARAKDCWDPSHGHSLNGGNYYAEGNRNLMDRLRARIAPSRPDAVFASEEINEAYIDKMDGFLTLDFTRGGNQPPYSMIPLFSAVYHDYTILFGSDAGLSAPPDRFAALMATHVIQGFQPTLSELNPPLIEESGENANYLKDLVTCYHEIGKKYLRDGEWLRPPAIAADSLKLPIKWKQETEVSIPAVLHSLWRAPDGDLGLVLTNPTGSVRRVEFTLDLAEYGLEGIPMRIRARWPRNSDFRDVTVTGSWTYRDRLAPGSILFFEISARGEPEGVPVRYPGFPFSLVRRGENGRFDIHAPGEGFEWTSGRKRLSTNRDGEVFLGGHPVLTDFLLLQQVDPEEPPVDESGRFEMALSQLDHYRAVPGIPLTISCRVSSRDPGAYRPEDIRLSIVQPRDIRRAVRIDPKGTPLRDPGARTNAEDPTRLFDLTATDMTAIGHAITLVAEADIRTDSGTLTLTDRIRVPCDYPLLVGIRPGRDERWIPGKRGTVEIDVENISDYPLTVSARPFLPAGWSTDPAVIPDLPVPPAGKGGSRRILRFDLTPPETGSDSSIPLSFSIAYNSTPWASIRVEEVVDLSPRLVPGTSGSWRPDQSPGRPTVIRGRGTGYFYLKGGESARIDLSNRRVASIRDEVSYSLFNPNGTPFRQGKLAVGEERIVTFPAAGTGTYTIQIDAGRSSCAMESNVRYMVFEATRTTPLNLFKTKDVWYFYVPKGSRSFTLHVDCGGENEPADVNLFSPGGEEVLRWEKRVILNGRFAIDVPPGDDGKIWKIDVGPKEDISLSLSGDALPYLAGHPGRLLVRKSDL